MGTYTMQCLFMAGCDEAVIYIPVSQATRLALIPVISMDGHAPFTSDLKLFIPC